MRELRVRKLMNCTAFSSITLYASARLENPSSTRRAKRDSAPAHEKCLSQFQDHQSASLSGREPLTHLFSTTSTMARHMAGNFARIQR